MNAVLQAAVPQGSVSQPCNVQPVPTSAFTSGPPEARRCGVRPILAGTLSAWLRR